MRKSLLILLSVTLVFTALFATPLLADDVNVDPPYVIKFSEDGLDGWNISGDSSENITIVENEGVDVLQFVFPDTGNGPTMRYDKKFKDFKMTVRMKFTRKNTVRMNLNFRFHQEWPTLGYVLRVTRNSLVLNKQYWGITGGSWTDTNIATGSFANVGEDWFDFTLIAKGQKIEVWINDVQAMDYWDPLEIPDRYENGIQLPDQYTSHGEIMLWAYNADFLMQDIYFEEPDGDNDAPDEPSGISLEKQAEGFKLTVEDYNPAHSYQIWTYEKVGKTVFGELDEDINQWNLFMPYTLGSDPAFTADGDNLSILIPEINSVDDTYTIAVKVKDGDENFVGQYKDSFTQAQVGELVINKVLVDDQMAEGVNVVDIADGSVDLEVFTNITENVMYSGTDEATDTALAASGNTLSWDISNKVPGFYAVTVQATDNVTVAQRQLHFHLYDSGQVIGYAETEGLTVDFEEGEEYLEFDLASVSPVNAEGFKYTIGEPWRKAHYKSELLTTAGHLVDDVFPTDKYGYYQVTSYLYRDGGNLADDGDILTIHHARDGGVSLNLTATKNEDPLTLTSLTEVSKGKDVILTAESNLTGAKFSFWRRDANGWVLVKDYGTGSLTWIPSRVGLYSFQIRVKAADGLTYEALGNLEFEVKDDTDEAATVSTITLNEDDLEEAKARTPILLVADATADTENLLYKFIISNDFIHYVETAYSVNSTYLWLPGKAGDYKISVLVKNDQSFGKYDAIENFTLTVN